MQAGISLCRSGVWPVDLGPQVWSLLVEADAQKRHVFVEAEAHMCLMDRRSEICLALMKPHLRWFVHRCEVAEATFFSSKADIARQKRESSRVLIDSSSLDLESSVWGDFERGFQGID